MGRSAVTLVAVAATAALVTPAGAVAPAPLLRLTQAKPLVLAGAHFRKGEAVTVIVHTPRAYLRRVVTRADGTFTADFGTIQAAKCSGLRAEARGAVGDRASLLVPRRACTALPPGTTQ